MPNVKRLQLQNWMSMDDPCLFEDHPEILPIFRKPGYYLFGDICWFENLKGRAYMDKSVHFKYELFLLEASELNIHQMRALKEVVQQKLATHKQRVLYHMHLVAMSQKRSIKKIRKKLLRFYIYDSKY